MSTNSLNVRPPVIVIMGHIDHGKSALLDYIRKSDIVASEAGGITQHLGSYEVIHTLADGNSKKITFLDTPGHAAFSAMRARGATVADVAVLVVSAEEGVKQQTLEALSAIQKSGLPYIVAITKIDKENANVDRVKQDLAAHEIFIEGYGGSVPCVPISSKTGAGISELLDMMLLVAEMRELRANPSEPAEGVVIESSIDSRRGALATLLILNGTLCKGDVLIIDGKLTPVRVLESHLGKPQKEATFSAPVRISGCPFVPEVGSTFKAYKSRKEAEIAAESSQSSSHKELALGSSAKIRPVQIPLVLKTDVNGSLEAIEKEIRKLETDEVGIRIVQSGVGPICETDIKAASGSSDPIVVGFNVKADSSVQEVAEKHKITVQSFEVIYELLKFIETEIERRRPRVQVEQSTGSVKIIKVFNREKDKQVVGGTVLEGKMVDGAIVKIIRHEHEIGRGKLVQLQTQKLKVKEVESGNQCGMLVDAKMTIAAGDLLEDFTLVTK